jgi:hypothetical protein
MISTDIVNKFKELVTQCELFLFESPCNNYQPAPPTGWFAMRSHKRRIFMQLVNGAIPNGDEVQRRINAEEFTEYPLT